MHAVAWRECPWALVNPEKAIRVGVGLIKICSIRFELKTVRFDISFIPLAYAASKVEIRYKK